MLMITYFFDILKISILYKGMEEERKYTAIFMVKMSLMTRACR